MNRKEAESAYNPSWISAIVVLLAALLVAALVYRWAAVPVTLPSWLIGGLAGAVAFAVSAALFFRGKMDIFWLVYSKGRRRLLFDLVRGMTRGMPLGATLVAIAVVALLWKTILGGDALPIALSLMTYLLALYVLYIYSLEQVMYTVGHAIDTEPDEEAEN